MAEITDRIILDLDGDSDAGFTRPDRSRLKDTMSFFPGTKAAGMAATMLKQMDYEEATQRQRILDDMKIRQAQIDLEFARPMAD